MSDSEKVAERAGVIVEAEHCPTSDPVDEEAKVEVNEEAIDAEEKAGSEDKSQEENLLTEEDPETQAATIKQYQQTLQELKEEIARLNKKLDSKNKEPKVQHSEEELFKLQCMCKYAKEEVRTLTSKLENLQKLTEANSENLEQLKSNSYDDETSNEKIADLSNKIRVLEEEYLELSKSSNEINIADLDKILSPEANPKLINEFFVNVQKRLSSLESENASLSSTLKKTTLETNKLKEKCDNASSRYKSNDELKNKLKDLEDTFVKYSVAEAKLTEDLRKAEEEFALHHHRPENKHDQASAQKLLDDLQTGVKNDKDEIEKLEFMLQEKKNLLRAARAYGLQRSKTSNKLRNDMEVLGLLLIEKDQNISKLRKEIDELKLKQLQVDLEIKELNEKKKAF
jgi:chromosome segregation ATPase